MERVFHELAQSHKIQNGGDSFHILWVRFTKRSRHHYQG